MNKDKVLLYATMAIPRYTSYPTAVDFVTLSDQQRIEWLGTVSNDEPVSLYLHVPYCRQLCHYCGCHAKSAIRDDVIEGYADSLADDIYLQASYLKVKPRVGHIHWGGGTPSILPRHSFEKIMTALESSFVFDKKAEHAIELDPRTVTPTLVEILRDIGVNRASLGVQDINGEVQKAIGRIQPFATVARAVKLLRQAGINKLNFDLIYGLPLQTQETLRQTCDTVAALSPDRIACYGYAHLPKRRANQKLIDASKLPGAMERFRQAEVVGNSFLAMGYVAVGIDHFAKPDDPLAQAALNAKLHRNFQGYTDDLCATLIGFGCSSISQFRQGFAQIQPDIGQYRRAIADKKLATFRGIAIDDDDRMRSALIGELMCNFTVDLNKYGGEQRFNEELALLKTLQRDNVAEAHAGVITMTKEGRPFVRAVAALFDSYRKINTAKFSSAV